MTKIESLITEKRITYKERWAPHFVEYMEDILDCELLSGMPKHQKKNIVYSLQYLQYLDVQIEELNLHSVINAMVYKTYVITGMSIIESLFHYILKSIGKWRKIEWVEESSVESQRFKGNDEIERKYVVTTLKQLNEPVDDEMTFDSIINKIQNSSIFSSRDFPYIKKYKKLRNRVHLQIGENDSDTDYFNFVKKDYIWTKYLLFNILSNPKFDNTPSKLDFLALSEEEIELAEIKVEE